LQASTAWEAESKCAGELTTIRDAGVKLFKQVCDVEMCGVWSIWKLWMLGG